MGKAIMAELGVERFEEAGVEPSDIHVEGAEEDDSPGQLLGDGAVTEAEAAAILDTWEADCADVAALFAQAGAEEFGLEGDGLACLEDRLREDGLARTALMASFTDDDEDPPEEVLTELVAALASCSEEGGGLNDTLVDSMAESIAADGELDEEQSRCVAQGMLDALGIERLMELGVSDGLDSGASPEVQQEVAQAVLQAASDCDVPLSSL